MAVARAEAARREKRPARGTLKRPAGGGDVVAKVGGEQCRGRHAEGGGGAKHRPRAFDERLAQTLGVGEDEDKAGVLVGGGEVAMADRLELERRGGQSGALFDLEGQLPCGRIVDPRAHQQEAGAACERGGRGLRRGLVERCFQHGARSHGVECLVAERAGQCRRGDHRGEVPDRVTPALVLFIGLEDMVGECGAGRAFADRDQRGDGSGCAGRRERLVRRPRAALMGDGQE